MTNTDNTSSVLPYTDFLRRMVSKTNDSINSLMSVKPLPLWINPLNMKFYQSPAYSVGDIVLAITDKNLVLEYLEPYIREIADYIDLPPTFFKERNNWEVEYDFYNTILYVGEIIPALKLQPLTIMSTSVYGFDLYISMTGGVGGGFNYDMPGMSDSWLNLRTASDETLTILLDEIIEKVEDSDILPELSNEALNLHLKTQHMNAGLDYSDPDNPIPDFTQELALHKYLDSIEDIYASRANATNDILRMPVVQDDVVIGQTTLINASTTEYSVSSIINYADLDMSKPITLSFIPNESLNIIISTVLDFGGEYLTVDQDVNSTVEVAPGEHALAVDSLYELTDDRLIYRHGNIGTPLLIASSFAGFEDKKFVVTTTPIGKIKRTDKSEIQCVPFEEIEREPRFITFKINPKYVWESTALNINISGKRFY